MGQRLSMMTRELVKAVLSVVKEVNGFQKEIFKVGRFFWYFCYLAFTKK